MRMPKKEFLDLIDSGCSDPQVLADALTEFGSYSIDGDSYSLDHALHLFADEPHINASVIIDQLEVLPYAKEDNP